jgi:curli production assembly/transport component CsgG
LTPYIFCRGGFGLNDQFENIHAKVQYGAGLEYMASDKFGIKIYVGNLNFSDNIDYLERRSRRLLLSIWLGLTYYFGNKK